MIATASWRDGFSPSVSLAIHADILVGFAGMESCSHKLAQEGA